MIKGKDSLRSILNRIDGRGYKAYKDIAGHYKFENFTLYIDYVQGDPFAAPSRIRIRVPHKIAGFAEDLYNNDIRKTALEDYLTRQVYKQIGMICKNNRGTGKSGRISVQRCGQEILKRTSVVIAPDFIEARLTIGLPAAGRIILARQAEEMLFDELPEIIERSIHYNNLDKHRVQNHVLVCEDQHHLRQQLEEYNLVSFIANGSILPRESGVSDKPLRDNVKKFVSPPSLEIEISLPNRGAIRGMGIPKGVTLIVGGGYHGKSTLLRAIERGVYNHIPGDGREYIATVPSGVKVRAEDGRRIEQVDISPFISNLPNNEDTSKFSTDNASGSTSQAANIMEALEVESKLLLLDEDTSATNFMIRDARMQKLVRDDKEPITPFIDRIRQIYEKLGVSTILVLGGSGDYFDVADRVIMMDNYVPRDVTLLAKEITQQIPVLRQAQAQGYNFRITHRIPIPQSLSLEGRKTKVKARGVDTIQYGLTNLELDYVEQLIDINQTQAVALIIQYALKKYIDGHRTLNSVIDNILEDIEVSGLDIISPFNGQHPGEYALPRKQEIAAAFNRLRVLKVHY
jgi:predicted ABC-class ATPase